MKPETAPAFSRPPKVPRTPIELAAAQVHLDNADAFVTPYDYQPFRRRVAAQRQFGSARCSESKRNFNKRIHRKARRFQWQCGCAVCEDADVQRMFKTEVRLDWWEANHEMPRRVRFDRWCEWHGVTADLKDMLYACIEISSKEKEPDICYVDPDTLHALVDPLSATAVARIAIDDAGAIFERNRQRLYQLTGVDWSAASTWPKEFPRFEDSAAALDKLVGEVDRWLDRLVEMASRAGAKTAALPIMQKPAIAGQRAH